jgi:hypothetical protein
MKTYHGMRTEAGCTVVVEEDGEFTGLDHRYDPRNHSPDGYVELADMLGWIGIASQDNLRELLISP